MTPWTPTPDAVSRAIDRRRDDAATDRVSASPARPSRVRDMDARHDGRERRTMGASPRAKRPSARELERRRRTRTLARWLALALLGIVMVLLKTTYPGDRTIRAASESWARLMFSRRGFSFGRLYERSYARAVRIDAKEGSIETTRRGHVVQGTIANRPRWTKDLRLQDVVNGEKREGRRKKCFFYVEYNEPVLVLYDDGEELRHHLELDTNGLDVGQFRCTFFKGVRKPSDGKTYDKAGWDIIDEPESGGKVAMMSTATTLGMLSAYHRTLVNHQAYAEHHGYGSILALVSPNKLEGRSAKFAKHLSMGTEVLRGEYAMVCHTDLDAWFASWDPLSRYSKDWPEKKSLFFGDTGQVWLNSGLICARSNEWTVSLFERTINAVYQTEPDPETGKIVNLGFKRDQPALWHVLGLEWANNELVPYKGQSCSMWSECNPDSNPIECWHWCFWDALQRTPSGWRGLHDVNKFAHVFLDPLNNKPQMHRMCLSSCYSVLSRAQMEICSSLTGWSRCLPRDVDKMSLCNGEGCLKQLTSHGGAWLKHTGHQHWLDKLPTCIPRSKEEAQKEKRSTLSLCDKSRM